MSILIALLISTAVASLVLAVALLIWDLRRPDEEAERRLEAALLAGVYRPPEKEPDNRIDRAFYRLIERSGTSLERPAALALVLGLAVVGCAVPLVLFESLPAAAVGTVAAPALALLWWEIQGVRRYAKMQKNLPETLELVADAVRAGESLEQATAMVAEQAPTPLKEEFGYCASQLRLGHAPVAVLNRMARRIPVPEFKIFSTAVLVHRQTGGDLALLAQRLANSARDRGEFYGHVAAVTAGSRLSIVGLVVATAAALGLLAWLRPEYLEAFLSHPMGPGLLVIAGVLQALGILWVWRVLKVQF